MSQVIEKQFLQMRLKFEQSLTTSICSIAGSYVWSADRSKRIRTMAIDKYVYCSIIHINPLMHGRNPNYKKRWQVVTTEEDRARHRGITSRSGQASHCHPCCTLHIVCWRIQWHRGSWDCSYIAITVKNHYLGRLRNIKIPESLKNKNYNKNPVGVISS